MEFLKVPPPSILHFEEGGYICAPPSPAVTLRFVKFLHSDHGLSHEVLHKLATVEKKTKHV